ncbi:MAG TPA: class I SAM-dependent methyltransferase [Stellaceae bacterium]|nr:class I SAM-dependent methyltransferase [Stellaceae bacterium]
MWWFAALHANLITLYRRFALRGSATGQLLDAGCGTGGLLARIARELPGTRTVGLDADATACEWAAEKSARPICAGSINTLPFADAAFTAIVSVDVLCHGGVDEAAALGEFRRCLADGGILILNLPAYRWLMSRHDVAVYNVRRYTRGEVARSLRAAGFRPVYSGYWNMVLFPLMVATRKLLPAGDGSDVKLQPGWVEALCRAATSVERGLIRAGLRFPFGGSVLAVARKTGDAHG